MGIVTALALRIWRTNENARVAGKTLCFRLRVCFAREAALRMPVHHSCTPRLVRGPPLTSRLSVTMASITASSVAVRAVVGRKSFLAGNARVAAAAPKTVNKARLTVRAADEDAAPAAEETAVEKAAPRSKDDLYLMGVSDQNMTYLDGSLPGDFGFDPLGMSDPEGAGGFVNPQ